MPSETNTKRRGRNNYSLFQVQHLPFLQKTFITQAYVQEQTNIAVGQNGNDNNNNTKKKTGVVFSVSYFLRC